ncbi:hypothetical protein PROFUN_15472 [Planoprotostelium fungivorum]|uniref:Uncharacterized protein n=1 Tax=Planoprotostelium fungivorum TaxID=1890364 RepID=A0A2P6MUL0_9EUKA|nr:hypothetical protein PROFUN_15472 [Planoprotostelium fungivorum]
MLAFCVLFGNPLQNICKRSRALYSLYAVCVEMYTLKSYKRHKEAKGSSPSPNMPLKAFETPADLAQAAKDYGGDTWREQMSYITQTGSAGQKACLREEGLSTSNINKAFLDAAKDILKNN